MQPTIQRTTHLAGHLAPVDSRQRASSDNTLDWQTTPDPNYFVPRRYHERRTSYKQKENTHKVLALWFFALLQK